jgi:integrase
MDVQRSALVLPNRKNPSRPAKTVHLRADQAGLPGALVLWARDQLLADDEPLFFSRKRRAGRHRALGRAQAWRIVKQASARAAVQVLALRDSQAGAAGEPAPVHPHLFRHARVRQIVRSTKSLPLAQRQAGWSRLVTAYLTIGDREAAELMASVPE